MEALIAFPGAAMLICKTIAMNHQSSLSTRVPQPWVYSLLPYMLIMLRYFLHLARLPESACQLPIFLEFID